jgi:Glucose / Sorbosone dehydrogenase
MTIARAAHLRETDCVAGHVELELRNVTAKYAFERSYRFLVIHRISKIPRGPTGHQNRHLAIDPKTGAMFVGVGSSGNIGNIGVEPEVKASIQRFEPDSGQTTFASGMRNPTTLAFHPTTGELYAGVQERDGLGDNLPPDYFTRVEKGAFYGWRKNGFKAPIIMLTGHNTDSDTILGLESAANDYVTKPFRFAVLLARIRAHAPARLRGERGRRLHRRPLHVPAELETPAQSRG